MKVLTMWILLLITFAVTGCKDDVQPINEEEVINEVVIQLTAADQSVYTLRYYDADGDLSGSPVITADTLPLHSVLEGTITLTNSLVQPAEDITEEVREEGDDHQLFYIVNGNQAPDITYRDVDNNQLPIGLAFTMATKDATQATLTVILRHLPNKTAIGVKEGDIANAGGETDIQIDFPLIVQ